MTRTDQLFRRNFVVAATMHGVLILGVVLFEGWSARRGDRPIDAVEIVLPDYKGDMPKGAGFGKGVYTPQPPAGGHEGSERAATPPAAALPSDTEMGADETPAPAHPAVPVHADPGDVYVAKKDKAAAKPKKAAAPTETAKGTATKATAPATKPAVAPKTTSATAKVRGTGGSGNGTGTGKGDGPSAKDIRNVFAGALKAGKGGTGYGDNRPAGGGNGSSDVIGSKNGVEDGYAGGVGAGTPFASYLKSVHDRIYEAWRQPGRELNYDKSLVCTVRLRIARDGTILDTKLVGHSGSKIMDDSALQAAHGVLRLDPLPQGLGTAMGLEIPVEFQLEG